MLVGSGIVMCPFWKELAGVLTFRLSTQVHPGVFTAVLTLGRTGRASTARSASSRPIDYPTGCSVGTQRHKSRHNVNHEKPYNVKDVVVDCTAVGLEDDLVVRRNPTERGLIHTDGSVSWRASKTSSITLFGNWMGL